MAVLKRGKVWYVIIPFHDADGKYKRDWQRATAWGYPNTERGAQQAERARLSEGDRGASLAPNRATVDAWISAFLEGKHVKPNSRYSYRQRYTLYIKPHLGDVLLRDLTKTRVRQWHRALLERKPKPLAPATIAAAHAILSTALREAVSEGMLTQNVAAAVKPPSIPRPEPHVWTPEQLATFLRAAEDDDLYALWLLCGVAGLRRGEALTLRWDDVDWQGRRVNIRRTYTRNAVGQRIVGTSTKTRDSAAPVDVPQSCIDALRAHQDRQAFLRQSRLWKEQGYVFARNDGAPVTPSLVDGRLDKLARLAGLPPMTMRGLRHTAATFAFARGEHPKTVQAMLRHSRMGMTADIYAHHMPSTGQQSAERADAALRSLAEG